MAVALSGVMVMSPQACAPTHTESASPAPVAIAASGATSMTITWSAVGGARSYDLVYAGTGLAGPITVTRLTTLSRTISGLTPGGRYEAQVRAVTRRGAQPWSATAVVTLTAAAATPAQENPVVTAPPATPAPAAPAGTTGTGTGTRTRTRPGTADRRGDGERAAAGAVGRDVGQRHPAVRRADPGLG